MCLSIIEIVEKYSKCVCYLQRWPLLRRWPCYGGSGALGHFVISTPVCRAQGWWRVVRRFKKFVSLNREHFERGVSFYARQKCCISNLIKT